MQAGLLTKVAWIHPRLGGWTEETPYGHRQTRWEGEASDSTQPGFGKRIRVRVVRGNGNGITQNDMQFHDYTITLETHHFVRVGIDETISLADDPVDPYTGAQVRYRIVDTYVAERPRRRVLIIEPMQSGVNISGY